MSLSAVIFALKTNFWECKPSWMGPVYKYRFLTCVQERLKWRLNRFAFLDTINNSNFFLVPFMTSWPQNIFSLLDILSKFHYVSQEPPISHFLQHDATPKIYSAIFGGSIIHYKICSRSAFWFESQASCGQISNWVTC